MPKSLHRTFQGLSLWEHSFAEDESHGRLKYRLPMREIGEAKEVYAAAQEAVRNYEAEMKATEYLRRNHQISIGI